MSSPSARSRWDPLSTTALFLLVALVVLVAQYWDLFGRPPTLQQLESLQTFVVVSLLASVVSLVIARRRWRQLQATVRAREAAEGRARVLFEGSPLPMWVFDERSLRFLDVNDAAVRNYGWSRDEFLSMTVLDVRPPEERPQILESLRRLPEESHARRHRHWRKDGSAFTVEVDAHTLMYGEQRACLAIAEDITARLQAEQTIRDSEAQFRAMADASPAGIVMTAPNGGVQYANRAWLQMVGLPLDHATGDGWARALHPDDRDRVTSAWRQSVADITACSSTARFVTSDGRIVWWRSQTAPVLTGDRLIGHVAVFIDESEQRSVEDALRESEERFRQLAENLPAVVYLVEPRRPAMLFISPAYEAIWGRTRESLYAHPWSFLDAVHPEDRERVEREYQTRRHTRLNITYRIARPDGAEVWIEDLQFPIRHADGRIYLIAGLAFDITHRHRLEAQLMQAQKMESLGRMAGGVAHDFNNLLTVILSYAHLLKHDTDERDRVRGLEEIEAAGQRASALTRQLLTFARRQIVEPELVDVNELTQGMTSMLAHLIGEDIHVELETTATPPFIRADPTQIEQVIVNLSVNARDAMPTGGVLRIATGTAHVTADATSAEVPAGDYVTMTVSDTGTGIPPEWHRKVFEPFFTTKPKGHGTGLGLSTAYGIVSQSGGHVSMASELGRGTTFVCYFPQAHAAGAQVRPREDVGARTHGQETVLLVEDEPMVREVARRALERHGYVVLTACDGVDGLRVASAHDRAIHLVITDVVMPLMGGREMATELKRVRPEVKTLFVSGYDEELSAHGGGLEAGVEFLPKPYLPATLSKRVRQLLDA